MILKTLRDKNLHTWLRGYARDIARRTLERPHVGPRHLLFAFCDHYEPHWGRPSEAVGEARVRAWLDRYGEMSAPFRDADGRRPQHGFFFPVEEYRPVYFEMLTEMVRRGYGEVELHLHFDGWTEQRLRDEILAGLDLYAKWGHFSRDADGRIRYAFIHGNWALSNGRPDGKWSGVDAELPILFETGCYADFTFPAAPDVCQPDIVNQIYWPVGDLSRKRAYEWGERARVGRRYRDRVLLVEGPLALGRKAGSFAPKLENGAVTAQDPGTPHRIKTWVDQNIIVEGRPEWVFVKVYTHGAPEKHADSHLGEGGRTMHRELTTRYNDGERWVLHYVTAREMFNIASAAMDGRSGDPNAYRDYVLPPPPARTEAVAGAAAE